MALTADGVVGNMPRLEGIVMLRVRGVAITQKQIERFWSRVAIRGPDDCWEWQWGRNSKIPIYAYGVFYVRGAGSILTHRLALSLHLGRTVLEPEVMHSCDNPPCCNPRHLSGGTHQQNMQDMIRKGRCEHQRGIDRPHSKLTEDDVREIRKLRNEHDALLLRCVVLKKQLSKRTISAVARRFGVDANVIRGIERGTAWKHIH